jgi:ClpP class serine protease
VWSGPKLLAVSVNTSEGTYSQAEEIIKSLRRFSEKYSCPVYTFAEDVAVGPGYLLLSAGHKVFADNFSLIGGISANISNLDLVELGKQQGLKVNVEAVGKFKVRNHPFIELSAENKAWVQKLLDTRMSIVKELVLERRGNKIPREKTHEDLALGGETFNVEKAINLGLVDHIKSFREILDKNYDECAVDEIKLKTRADLVNRYQARIENALLGINEKMICDRLNIRI